MSVRPSRIVNNSVTACANLEERCHSHSSLKVERLEVRVTRPINADTHRPSYLANSKVYELQIWYTDGWRWIASATGAMTYKVKGQGHVVSECSTCVIRGRWGQTVSAEPGGHTSCLHQVTALSSCTRCLQQRTLTVYMTHGYMTHGHVDISHSGQFSSPLRTVVPC